MVEIELHRAGAVERIALRSPRAELRFTPGNDWRDAVWRFDGEGSASCFMAAEFDAITACSGALAVSILDGAGASVGDFPAQAVLSGIPAATHCFLYTITADGMWEGHTIARAFGRIVAMPYVFDPA